MHQRVSWDNFVWLWFYHISSGPHVPCYLKQTIKNSPLAVTKVTYLANRKQPLLLALYHTAKHVVIQYGQRNRRWINSEDPGTWRIEHTSYRSVTNATISPQSRRTFEVEFYARGYLPGETRNNWWRGHRWRLAREGRGQKDSRERPFFALVHCDMDEYDHLC